MTRYIFGGGGDGQSVSTTGTVRPSTAANVYNARTGGAIVTDILDMSGAPLAGVVTTDAYGQAIFQGPDGDSTVKWLDFGVGPRWALSPKDNASVASALITSWAAGSPTITTPTINGAVARSTAIGNPGFVVNALSGQTADLQRWQVNGVTKANIDSAGNLFATNFPGTAVQTYTPVLTAVTTNPTLGTSSVSTGIYVQLGKLVIVLGSIKFGTSGAAAGSGNYRISLPVAANTTVDVMSFNFRYTCAGGTGYTGNTDPTWASSTTVGLQYHNVPNAIPSATRDAVVSNSAPGVWTNNDQIRFAGFYIAA